MLAGACVLLKKKKRPAAAKWYGKVGTIFFYLSAGTIVVMEGILHMHNTVSLIVSYCLLGITAVLMLYALYEYARIFLDTMRSDSAADQLDLMNELHAGKKE